MILPLDPEQELKELQKRQVRVAIIDGVGSILAGLGIFGKLAKDGGSLPPLLANSTVTTAMIVIGAVILTWGATQIIAIARRRVELQRELGN